MEHIQNKTLNEEEKKALRLERFNDSAQNIAPSTKEESKKLLERQKRFGTITAEDDIEKEKKRKRLERFGSSTSNQNEETEKLKKRAIRFGLAPDTEKLKQRAIRFGLVPDEESLKKRAERFKDTLNNDKDLNIKIEPYQSYQKRKRLLPGRRLRNGRVLNQNQNANNQKNKRILKRNTRRNFPRRAGNQNNFNRPNRGNNKMRRGNFRNRGGNRNGSRKDFN